MTQTDMTRTIPAPLLGEVALVTGAGRGIGRGIAHELAGQGADIALVDIHADALAQVADEITEIGSKVTTFVADIADRDAVFAAVEHAAAALGGFLFGFDTAVINGAVDALAGEFALDAALKGFSVSSALLGCAVGAWFAGQLANRWGRIPVMIVAAALFLISAIGSGLAIGVVDLIVWRVVGGLGVGAASVIVPAYIAEVSPARVRGMLGSMQQLAIVTGIFAALLSNALLAGISGGAAEVLWWGLPAWRWMFMLEAIPALVYGLMALCTHSMNSRHSTRPSATALKSS